MRLTDSTLEIDHIRPRSNGGEDNEGNLALACCFCNQAKKARTLKEFLKWLKGIRGRGWCPITDGSTQKSKVGHSKNISTHTKEIVANASCPSLVAEEVSANISTRTV
jgi:CRISPR/Cas system Type II protein with McrA/HNH and RuvC-like nuclease domain